MIQLFLRHHFGQALLILILGALFAGGAISCVPKPMSPSDQSYGVNPVSFLSEVVEFSQYAQATEQYKFRFPDDHGTHNEYRNEWWYFTGNLYDEQRHHYGFQLTIFRSGVGKNGKQTQSNWAVSNVYMAHFTITHTKNNEFYQSEKLSRDSLGLAGASHNTLDVWVDDWSIKGTGTVRAPIQLSAKSGDWALALDLVSAKPIVLQGSNGFSLKSSDGKSASHYYSISRLLAQGEITVNGTPYKVEGSAWMDREWSTSSLGEDQVGWDWFSLQLSDGRDLMFYQLRDGNGRVDPFSSGTIIFEDGSTRRLSVDDVTIQVLDSWQSPHGGEYPIKWRMRLPADSIEMEIIPYVENQELDVSIRYWEGAVKLNGTANGQPISGNGYVEMTGYATGSGGRF